MRTMTAAPATIVQAIDPILDAARRLLDLPLTLERITLLPIAPGVLLAIEPHRNEDSPERRFCGWLAAEATPLEALDGDCHHHGPWHTATPGALLAIGLDAYAQRCLAQAEQTPA